MEIKKSILSRLGVVYLVTFLAALAILGQVLRIQMVSGETLRAEAESISETHRVIPSSRGNILARDSHYFYGHYYACQAMFLAGGEYWATYYPAIRELLIARQNRTTGGWTGEAGEDYATAMALIILQMPNRYLPVFHGKGAGG